MNGKSLDDMTDEERWRLFPIILSNHQSSWKKSFLDEKIVLEPIIGSANIVRINHIGSTAVPGLIAKPTVDILLEIAEETDIPGLVSRMQEAGYRCIPQDDKPAPGLMFTKGYTEAGFKGQVFHIHVRYKGDWDEPYFRDYLVTHPEAAVEYGQLKQDLAVKYKYNRDAYTEGKTAFIKRITNLAKTGVSNP
ncbi:MAG: GrpB family protein [Dehalogenimonas sp.]